MRKECIKYIWMNNFVDENKYTKLCIECDESNDFKNHKLGEQGK